jgi:cell wall-associated NlpC family hydrolase
MTADDIVAYARQTIGTRFRHQGRLVGVGMDCVGVAIHVANCCGVDVFEVAGYARTPSNGLLEWALDNQNGLYRVEKNERRPGDVLLMRFAKDPQHVAICAGETIIHAYEDAGKCCEHRLSSAWAARIVRVYRFRGIE